jgi:2-keto-4-pentenoate hydratase/2-oxohepta-3-ene-1,7-dioic acid hydratase in catechol pathway
MDEMTITLRPGCVVLSGTIRTVEDLQTLIDRLSAIAGWLEADIRLRQRTEGPTTPAGDQDG